MKRLLIAGCGDLGIRLAAHLNSPDWSVHGLRRNVDALPATIEPVAADLLDPVSLEAVAGSWDAIVYQATPDEYSEDGYRRAYVDGLANLLEHVGCRRLIFVSSTAVYGHDGGEWVDETSPTEPARFNGRILLEAEARALDAAASTSVVRFAGIYGPGRDYLLRKLRRGDARCRRHPPQWTNRIHVDDCAAAIAHLIALERPRSIYCASDGHPAARCEVLDWLARRLGVPGPGHDDAATGMGKRVANARLCATGFEFRHPDYRSGYEEMLR